MPSDEGATSRFDAIVLDGSQRSALAATRSLGRHGARVIVADKSVPSLAGCSKYCSDSFRYPNPSVEPSAFIASLASLGRFAEPPVMIPCTDESLPAILSAGTALQHFATCLPGADAYRRLTDKWELYSLAQQCAVPVPNTAPLAPGVRSIADITGDSALVAVKPRMSVLQLRGRGTKLPVVLVARTALHSLLANGTFPNDAGLLIQDVVLGSGVGVSVVCDHGRVIAWFAHRRLREQPPSGGVSVYCESIALPQELQRYCAALIEATTWHGPAMFEFKVDEAGKAYLIEVNARLWGSVQLAIDCGIDVPHLMYRLARGEPVASSAGYAVGRRLRWLIGDLSHLYMVLWGKNVGAATASRLRTIFDVLSTGGRQTFVEDWRYADFSPLWHRVAAELRH